MTENVIILGCMSATYNNREPYISFECGGISFCLRVGRHDVNLLVYIEELYD